MHTETNKSLLKQLDGFAWQHKEILLRYHTRFRYLLEDDLDIFLALTYIQGHMPVVRFRNPQGILIHMMATACIVEMPDGKLSVLYDLNKHSAEFAHAMVTRLEVPELTNLLESLLLG